MRSHQLRTMNESRHTNSDHKCMQFADSVKWHSFHLLIRGFFVPIAYFHGTELMQFGNVTLQNTKISRKLLWPVKMENVYNYGHAARWLSSCWAPSKHIMTIWGMGPGGQWILEYFLLDLFYGEQTNAWDLYSYLIHGISPFYFPPGPGTFPVVLSKYRKQYECPPSLQHLPRLEM